MEERMKQMGLFSSEKKLLQEELKESQKDENEEIVYINTNDLIFDR
jgi:hypothetical protein